MCLRGGHSPRAGSRDPCHPFPARDQIFNARADDQTNFFTASRVSLISLFRFRFSRPFIILSPSLS